MIRLENYVDWIKKKHEGQKRKQGTPYYLHPVAVAKILKEKGFSEDYQIAGLCHDLLEDTETTYEELLAMTNEHIAEAVKLVTKEKGYQQADYMKRIQQHKMAHMVKLADRYHNLTETVLADPKFQKKYITETKTWYLDLAKGTMFEQDIVAALQQVEQAYLAKEETERD